MTKMFALQRILVPLLVVWSVSICVAAAAEKNHKLLNDPELPEDIDKRNVLLSKCSYYRTEKYEYANFTRLCEIDDINPPGYILQLPIYIQGKRDVLIKFSTRKRPAPNANVYEIAIAAWGNTKVIIRRKQGYEELTTVEADDIIAEDQPTKFVIEITTGGDIRVFSEINKTKPLATAHDDRPIPVKYMSFAIYEPSNAEFFYNCQLGN